MNLKSALAAVVILIIPSTTRAQGLHEGGCVVSILNQTANVQRDGSWVVPNVPANMGAVRARVSCLNNGVTESGASDFFTIAADSVNGIPKVTIGNAAATPVAIVVSAPETTLHAVAATVQLAVTARYADETTTDVSTAEDGTTYDTTNAGVATVSPDGLVTAHVSGRVLILALHDGSIDAIGITVLVGPDSDGDGMPDDFEVANELDPNNPVDALEDPDQDQLNNLDEFLSGTQVRNPDTDGDTILDGEELRVGHDGYVTSPLLYDTDGDGVWDQLEIDVGTDPTDPSNVNYGLVLVQIDVAPPAFTLQVNVVLAEETSRRLEVTGLMIDGHTLDMRTRVGTTYASSDLSVASFGAEAGRVYAGSAGNAVVTAANGTFQDTTDVTVVTVTPTALSFLALPGYANTVTVSGERAYVAAGAAGLHVIDVQDLANPSLSLTVNTPGNANGVDVVGGLAYVADGASGLQILDPSLGVIVGSADTSGDATAVKVRGSFAYVADGASGLAIFDVSDAAHPSQVGAVHTPGDAQGVNLSGDFALVAGGAGGSVGPLQGGVLVVDVSNPTAPVLKGATHTRINFVSHAAEVVVRNRVAYVADGSDGGLGGLRIINFDDATTPAVTGTTTDLYGLAGVALDGRFALAADFYFVNAVPIFDVVGAVPIDRGSINFSGAPSFRDDNGTSVAVRDGAVFLAGNRGGIGRRGITGDGGLHIGRYLTPSDDGTEAPTVSITDPPPGFSAPERNPIVLRADASDDVAVSSVRFLVDNVVVGTSTAAPFQLTYTLPPGATTRTISAIAEDYAGNQATATPVTLTVVADDLPTIAIVNPLAGAHFIEGVWLTLSARASDDVAIDSVEFTVDGSPLPAITAPPYNVDYQVPVAVTSLTIGASVTDSATNKVFADPVVVTVEADVTPPFVTILTPRDGDEVTEAERFRVTIGAIDDAAVTKVALYVNGVRQMETTVEPYRFDLSAPIGDTEMTLRAQAEDSKGYRTDSDDVVLTILPGVFGSKFPLVLCVERADSQGEAPAYTFPWTNDSYFFSAYRNQYLYPSTTLQALRDLGVTSITSLHARARTDSPLSTNAYAAGSVLRVMAVPTGSLQRTFSQNVAGAGTTYLQWSGPFTIQHNSAAAFAKSCEVADTSPNALSDCVDCGGTLETRNNLAQAIDLPNPVPTTMNILIDQLMIVGSGNSGAALWDVTAGGTPSCDGPQRAYGSGTFLNLNNLTTAYGVDENAFVWVFRGIASPGSPCFTTQLQQMLQLLLDQPNRVAMQ